MLTLYFAPGASSFAVHIALHEVGAAFEGKPMSFKNNDMRSPDFLAVNPEGKVPTLLIDGRRLTEVAAILYYLAKRFPEAGLLPRDDLEADEQALSWMSFMPSTLHRSRRWPITAAWEAIYSRESPGGIVSGVWLAAPHTKARGFVHGGWIAALTDKAMGHSCGYKMRGTHSLVTVSMSIDFISSAQIGQWLTVETDVIKTGSTICFAQSLVKADDAVIARANATFRVVPKQA